jgi:hypothetical protein
MSDNSCIYMSKSMSMSMFYLCLVYIFFVPFVPISYQRDHQVQSHFTNYPAATSGPRPRLGSVRKGELQLAARSNHKIDASSLPSSRMIGRREGSISNEWFFVQGEALHTGHYPPRVDALTKPTRLYSKEKLQAVHDVLASCSGEGMAKSLYYYRTGEILSRSTLDWLSVFVCFFILSLSLSIISFVSLIFPSPFQLLVPMLV